MRKWLKEKFLNLHVGCIVGPAVAASLLVGALIVIVLVRLAFGADWNVISNEPSFIRGIPLEKPMSLYSDVKVDLTHAEGISYHVYRLDGILHAGIGHKLTDNDLERLRVGDAVSHERVQQWFDIDYQRCLKAAEKHLPNFESYPRLAQLAVMNWVYQLGTGCFEEFPHATAYLKERQWKRAADEWLYADPRTKRWSKWRRETQHRCEQEAERLQSIGTIVPKGL